MPRFRLSKTEQNAMCSEQIPFNMNLDELYRFCAFLECIAFQLRYKLGAYSSKDNKFFNNFKCIAIKYYLSINTISVSTCNHVLRASSIDGQAVGVAEGAGDGRCPPPLADEKSKSTSLLQRRT